MRRRRAPRRGRATAGCRVERLRRATASASRNAAVAATARRERSATSSQPIRTASAGSDAIRLRGSRKLWSPGRLRAAMPSGVATARRITGTIRAPGGSRRHARTPAATSAAASTSTASTAAARPGTSRRPANGWPNVTWALARAEVLDRRRGEDRDAPGLVRAVTLLDEVRGDPRDVREHDQRVHGDQLPQPVAVHPERPARLRGEHEDPDVVRVRDAEHGERVRGPPPAAAGVEGAEQAERREPGQERHEGVGARLGGVEHRVRLEREDRGRDQACGAAGGAQPERVPERDERDPGQERRQPDRPRRVADLCRRPGEREVQRRRLLGVAHHAQHVAEPVVVDDPVHDQLVAEQAVAHQRQPQREREQHETADDGEIDRLSTFESRHRGRDASWGGGLASVEV